MAENDFPTLPPLSAGAAVDTRLLAPPPNLVHATSSDLSELQLSDEPTSPAVSERDEEEEEEGEGEEEYYDDPSSSDAELPEDIVKETVTTWRRLRNANSNRVKRSQDTTKAYTLEAFVVKWTEDPRRAAQFAKLMLLKFGFRACSGLNSTWVYFPARTSSHTCLF